MNTTSTGTRWKDNLRKGLLARIFCVLPSIRAINATTNAEETILTRRRILSEDEASEQNHGYFHSRLITLSHLPRSCSSRLTCHLRRATSVLLYRNFSRIFKKLTYLLSIRSSFCFTWRYSRSRLQEERALCNLYSCLVFCCPDDSYV